MKLSTFINRNILHKLYKIKSLCKNIACFQIIIILVGDTDATKRELYLSKIRPYYEIHLIKVLTGIRRCGKPILLKQIINELIDNGTTKESIIYINFEDFEYNKINEVKKLHDFLKTKTIDNLRYHLFFDEI